MFIDNSIGPILQVKKTCHYQVSATSISKKLNKLRASECAFFPENMVNHASFINLRGHPERSPSQIKSMEPSKFLLEKRKTLETIRVMQFSSNNDLPITVTLFSCPDCKSIHSASKILNQRLECCGMVKMTTLI